MSLPEGRAGQPRPPLQAPSRLHAAGTAAGAQAAELLDPETVPGGSAGALSALRLPQASCGPARARGADIVGPDPDSGGPAGGNALGAAHPAGGGDGDSGRDASVGFGLSGGERNAGDSLLEPGRDHGAEEFAAAAGQTSGLVGKVLGTLGSLPLGSSADGAAKP